MPRSGLVAVFAAVPLAAAVWLGGQEEPVPHDAEAATREKIESLVGRLGSSERADRVAAERELLDFGPWILTLLPASDDVPDPAARAALEQVRRRLEDVRAEQKVRPTLADVRVRGNLGEAASQLRSLGVLGTRGGSLSLTPEQAERKVALEREGEPFWRAVDELARQADLWPDRVDPHGGLSFRERTPDDDAERLAYSHAFRFAAGPVSTRPVAGNDDRRLVRVPVEVRAEPKLRPLFLSYASGDLALTTAAGSALPPFAPEAKRELPFADAGGAVEPRLDFVADAAVAGPLTLAGTMRMTVAAGIVPFVGHFKEMQTADGRVLPVERTETHDGVTIRFREMILREDGTAEVEIAVDYGERAPVFESHRAWVYHKDAHLACDVDRDGKWTSARIDPESGFSVAEAGGVVVLRYRFSGIPAEASMVRFSYSAPTEIVEVPVEFKVDGLTVVAEDAAPAEPVSAGSAAGP